MEQNGIKFTLVDTKRVRVSGFPELEGKSLLFRGRYGPHGHRNAKDKMLNYKGDLILRMELRR